ncbi:hypothetical protein ACJX0J_011859, partial [Zea mays]
SHASMFLSSWHNTGSRGVGWMQFRETQQLVMVMESYDMFSLYFIILRGTLIVIALQINNLIALWTPMWAYAQDGVVKSINIMFRMDALRRRLLGLEIQFLSATEKGDKVNINSLFHIFS